MFYGVINETCNNVDYLEIELENSLLFFESLNVIQESGIQIVQESFSDIVERVKELWNKFKIWVKSIWEKIKAIFTKKKDTIVEIKETNDKIQKGEVKEVKNESFLWYIKEDSEESGSKEIKWYASKTQSEMDKIMAEYMSELADITYDKVLEKYKPDDTGIVPDSFFDDYDDKCKRAKEKFGNTEIINQLFIENTFTDVNNINQLKTIADKITKASEVLDDNSKETRKAMGYTEEFISELEKGVNEVKENNIDDNNIITGLDGKKMSVNNFNRMISNCISTLHLSINFLAKFESMNIKYLNSNKVAIKKIESYTK